MKSCKAIIPIIAVCLTGCSTVQRLNNLMNETSESIQANREAVEYNTQLIRENAALVEASTKAIEENRRLLEAASGH